MVPTFFSCPIMLDSIGTSIRLQTQNWHAQCRSQLPLEEGEKAAVGGSPDAFCPEHPGGLEEGLEKRRDLFVHRLAIGRPTHRPETDRMDKTGGDVGLARHGWESGLQHQNAHGEAVGDENLSSEWASTGVAGRWQAWYTCPALQPPEIQYS
jgi:hypothetical protein